MSVYASWLAFQLFSAFATLLRQDVQTVTKVALRNLSPGLQLFQLKRYLSDSQVVVLINKVLESDESIEYHALCLFIRI